MKFGKSREEAAAEPNRGGDGSSYIKYLKAGDNTLHLADEPDKWVWYWEHYNPGGYPFPCTNDMETCPGCTSDVEKMQKPSRKIAFNAYDGNYTNVWKIPKSVAEKLQARYERNGTVTDRPFIITQYKKDNGFYDYDVEGQDKAQLPPEVENYLADPEDLLSAAYDEAWGDSSKGKQTSAKAQQAAKEESLQEKIGEAQRGLKVVREEPKSVSEKDLRAMEPWDLVTLCEKENYPPIPAENSKTTDDIVDWMLAQ